MSDALDRVAEAPARASEAEVAAVLAAVGVPLPRRSAPSFRTLQPAPEAAPHIVSEVEWV